MTYTKEHSDGFPEQSIVIERYDDIISIQQEKDSINLNYESIDELCKLLKKLKREKK